MREGEGDWNTGSELSDELRAIPYSCGTIVILDTHEFSVGSLNQRGDESSNVNSGESRTVAVTVLPLLSPQLHTLQGLEDALIDHHDLSSFRGCVCQLIQECTRSSANKDHFVGQIGCGTRQRIAGIVGDSGGIGGSIHWERPLDRKGENIPVSDRVVLHPTHSGILKGDNRTLPFISSSKAIK